MRAHHELTQIAMKAKTGTTMAITLMLEPLVALPVKTSVELLASGEGAEVPLAIWTVPLPLLLLLLPLLGMGTAVSWCPSEVLVLYFVASGSFLESQLDDCQQMLRLEKRTRKSDDLPVLRLNTVCLAHH